MFRFLLKAINTRKVVSRIGRRPLFRPALEVLEGRWAPAVLIANSVTDNTTADNLLTLRDAIAVVNGTLGRGLTPGEQAQVTGTLGTNDTIQFNLPSGPQTITLTGGPISITRAVTLTGPGASSLTISGNQLDRVFIVGHDYSKNLSLVAAISGLTIAGGVATASGKNYGAGLLNFGTLTVSNCTFSNNHSGSSGGGGIYNDGALTVNACIFTGNNIDGGGNGGGIQNAGPGTLTVSNSTFSGNTGTNGGSGGGIANNGTTTVSNTTFSGNTVTGNGAAMHNSGSGRLTLINDAFLNGSANSDGGAFDNDGTVTASNCTFSGNSAGSEGGAIDNHGILQSLTNCTLFGNTAGSRGAAISSTLASAPSHSIQVVNCTISGNRVTSSSGGGGILQTVPAKLFNTLVAGNFEGSGTTADDIAGGSVDSTSAFNLIGTGGSGGLVNGVNGNQVGANNPGLGTLASNGGPTQTIALLPGSPAIDRGSNTYVTAGETDQRGMTRIVNGTVDIGAFEVQPTSTASSFNVAGFPSPTTAGAAGTFTVTAKDGSGNTVTGYTGTVHFTSSDNQALLPADYSFVSGDNGVHTFSGTLKTAGSRSLTATDTTTASITGTQAAIVVNPAVANTFAVVGFPTPTMAGVAHNLTVSVKDSFGNLATGYTGTVSLSCSDGQASFAPASYTFTAADAATHAFSATLETAGTQSVTAIDTANSLSGSQTGIQVTAAMASSLAMTGYPTPTTAGAAHNLTVTVTDSFGNLATAYTGTVTLTSSDGQASFAPASYTFTTADAGIHAFSATLKTAGTQSITATDTANSLGGNQIGIQVIAATASSLTVGGYPTPTTAGAAHSATVTVRDSFGNLATGYTGTLTLSSSDGQASFAPASYTFTTADAGMYTFSATLKTAGIQSITATDTGTSLNGSQTGIQVTAAMASSLAMTGYPTPTTAGAAHNLTVTVTDSFGNLATGYTGTVTLTSSDGQASFAPASYTFTTADAGIHAFSATLKTAGTQSITATDTANSLGGNQIGIQVIAATASSLTVGGYPTPTTAGAAHSATVTARDSFGNLATGYTGTLTLSSSDGQASFAPASYTFTTADAGMYTFSATLKTADIQSITATDSGNSLNGSQTGIQVTAATASGLAVTGYPTPTTAGVAHNLTVTVTDSFGNLATGYTGTVGLSSRDGQASFAPASYTFTTADAGMYSFSATLETAGGQSLTATDTTNSLSASQGGIVVTAATASTLAVAGYPTPTAVGNVQTFTVTALDNYGNTAANYMGTIGLSSSDGLASFTPAGYTFIGGDAGMHTFSGTLNTVGTQAITAMDFANNLSGTETGILVTAGAAGATTLVVSGYPMSTAAGAPYNFMVTAEDTSGNTVMGYAGMVILSSSDSQAGFSTADYTFTTADAGVHVFSATLKTAGAQSITATDTANSLSGSQTGLQVTAATAGSLTVVDYPSPTSAGAAHSLTVTALDSFGNVATGYTGTVTLSSSDGQATFTPASYTFTNLDAGQYSFSATLKTAGSQFLTATDTANSLSASQTGIQVTAATASSLTLAGYPSPTTAGAAHTFTVTAKDSFGNLATGYTGTVSLSSSDGQAAFAPASYTFTNLDAGQYSFSATLKTAGSQSLTATDTANSLSASQTGIQVTAATASSLTVAGYASPTTAGAAHNFTVTARDSFGNLATGYTGTVSLSSSDGQAAFAPASYTFTTLDAGAHSFSATLKTAGSQSLTATDAANSLSASQTGIQVTAATASSLTLAGYPSPTTAGAAHTFTVTAKDSFGNLATGYTGTVSLSSSDGQAAFAPASYTFTNLDAGQYSFSATLKTAGSQSLTATDTANSLSASQTGIQVTAATASSLTVAGYASPTTAGAAHNFTVTARDSFGNLATGYTGTVSLSSSDGQAAFAPASYTFTTLDAGAHSFSATLKTAGNQSLTATDAANSLSASQTGIQVTAATASSLTLAGYPSPTTAGAAHNFTVTAKDSFGNLATGYTGTVSLSSSDGQAAFPPSSYTFSTLDAGAHSFSATLKTAGSQSLTATDTAHSLTAAQAGIVVTPAPASSLAVAGYPSPTTAGAAHNFTVTVRDSFGNLATGYRGTVHVTSSDSQAVLPANYTFASGDNGVRTFSATLKTVGNQSLTVTDTTTPSITGAQAGIVVNPASNQAMLTVNSVADSNTADSFLTLREAIQLVDGTLGRSLTTGERAQVTGTLGVNNTILFNLPSGPQTITLTGGALGITSPVTITGPGASSLTISGNNAVRVFVIGQIYTQNLSLNVSISGLTVSRGSALSGSNNYGGGLLNFGTLTVNNCTFSANAAGSSGGGAIYNDGALAVSNSTFSSNSVTSVGPGAGIQNATPATLTVSNCLFTGNTASNGASGAGLANSGKVVVSNSTFTGNTANSNGGGIYNSSSGTLTVSASTFANNSCGSDGGGIDNDGTLTVSASTLSGNTAASEGGGIGNKGTIVGLTNCTLFGNTAVSDGGGLQSSGSALVVNCTITANRVSTGTSGHFGGGIYNTSPVTLRNTIVAGNFQGQAPGTTANDVYGNVNSTSAFNLIGTGGSGGLTNGVNNNQVGVSNPGLGTLASNGGPTQTVALLPGSTAIDRGSNAYVTAGETDQRGLARIVNGTVDIGAFEVQTTSTPPGDQSATKAVAAAITLGSFADANSAGGPWTVDVNWGDGSTNTIFTANAQGLLGARTHTYLATGIYTLIVTVTDANHDASKAVFHVNVAG